VSGPLRAAHDELLVHTGQHYDDELSSIFVRELAVPPPDVELQLGGGTNTEQTARMLAALGELLRERRPAAVLVYGDTNSTLAGALAAAGVRRVNVSLDTRDADRFAHITRRGRLAQVIEGIAAAKAAGLVVKINMVALKGLNDDEIEPMVRWCADEGLGLTLIETMPLGEIEGERSDHYLPLDRVRRALEERYTLVPTLVRTGGPAQYYDVAELGVRLGMITPLTNNFCSGCNRIRVAATGTVYGCLGHDQKVELRELLRSGGAAGVNAALDELLAGKPRRHLFDIAATAPAVARHMSVTGG